VKKKNITDKDRADYFGVLPAAWTRYEAGRIEESIRKRLGR
jgi:transcriptional regulator with XRE-family HTH domain